MMSSPKMDDVVASDPASRSHTTFAPAASVRLGFRAMLRMVSRPSEAAAAVDAESFHFKHGGADQGIEAKSGPQAYASRGTPGTMGSTALPGSVADFGKLIADQAEKDICRAGCELIGIVLDGRRSLSILDAGAGDRVGIQLAEMGHAVAAVDRIYDVSSDGWTVVSDVQPGQLRLRRVDLATMNLGELFDGVLLCGVLHYGNSLAEQLTILNNAVQHVRSGGRGKLDRRNSSSAKEAAKPAQRRSRERSSCSAWLCFRLPPSFEAATSPTEPTRSLNMLRRLEGTVRR
jgi:hypothetical protein